MEHILIVEDDEAVANLLKRAFERANYQVSCALNIHDGFTLARQHNPALAIVDLRLPLGNGFMLIERLRCEPQFEKLVMVILTSDVTAEAQQRAAQFGCIILPKPFLYQELIAMINRLLPASDTEYHG